MKKRNFIHLFLSISNLQRLQQRRLNAYHAAARPRSEVGHYPSAHQQQALGKSF